MLFMNILKLHMSKIISFMVIVLILLNLFIFSFSGISKANYSEKFSKYPGYVEELETLQKEHPNWEFEILETGLDWNNVLKAEHRKNVTQKHDGIWNCQEPNCKDQQHEPGWYYASEATIAYYMDPRNSLSEEYIFQFEKLSFDSKEYSDEMINEFRKGVEQIVKNSNYLQGKIEYYNDKGEKLKIDKTYVDVIIEAAIESKVSPYHLASRICQEQGSGNGTAIISGTWEGTDEKNNSYKGLYNYYNWGATGSTTHDIILNALKRAKSYGWTDPEKSIKGGANKIASNFISLGQDTLYLQKFDVVDGGNGFYGNQYMTNVSATKSEGQRIKNAYKKLGLLDNNKIVFRIPVYNNMPKEKAKRPGTEKVVTEDVEVTGDNVNVREGKGKQSKEIAKLNKGDKVVRIEKDTQVIDGFYWDKVVLKNGTKGYIAREYIKEIELQSNANEKYIVVDYTNFRNGPGTEGTTVIETLAPGQIITVVEKDKYLNLNGESWYRILMQDGRYGYIGTGYSPDKPTIEKYNPQESKYDRVKVVCTNGLNLRKEPSTSSGSFIKTIAAGTILTRIQKDASTNQGFIWDKVTTPNGVVGYVVRQDKETGKPWIVPIDEPKPEIPEKPKEPTIEGKGFKIVDEKNILAEPNLTVEQIKKKYTDAVVIKEDKELSNTDKLSTGCNITIENKKYVLTVLGDVNGDGKIKSTDYMSIKNHIMGIYTLSNENALAADVNKDGKIKSTDYMSIKNHIMGISNITI